MNAKILGETIAKKMFMGFFQHPEYRGPKFNFETFPIENVVGVHIYQTFKNFSSKSFAQKEKTAKESSRELWDLLCKKYLTNIE